MYTLHGGRGTVSSKNAGRRPIQAINQLVGPLRGCGATLWISYRSAGTDTSMETNPACTARFSFHCKPEQTRENFIVRKPRIPT
jgi:hypothetical protein